MLFTIKQILKGIPAKSLVFKVKKSKIIFK